MISITAEIDVVKGSPPLDTLFTGNENLIPNTDISAVLSNFYGIIGTRKMPRDLFYINKSKLGYGAIVLGDGKEDYYIDKSVFDEYGNSTYTNGYIIKITSQEDISSFAISFDTTNNRHPNSLIVDDKEYKDDDAIFSIHDLNPNTLHTVVIKNWNTPNYPLVISGIYVDEKIEITKSNLVDFKFSGFFRDSIKLPCFGIINNKGSLSFNDNNGEILDYIKLDLLGNLKATSYINDTIANTKEKIGTFVTTDWGYDNNNRLVTVSLNDDLMEWQDIYVDGFAYDPRNPFLVLTNGNMADLYKWLYNKTPAKFNMLKFDELDVNTQKILNDTKVDYPFLKSNYLWQQWTKLCQVCGLYIYKTKDNRTACKYDLGE